MTAFVWSLAIAAIAALAVATLIAQGLGRLGFPLPPHNRRLGAIDGLRGYLSLSVMIHHFFMWSNFRRLTGVWAAPPVHFVNELGAGSVALFFMTTGLVFYPRVLTGLRATPWISVYISRVLRIMPLVVFSFAVVTAIVIARTGARLDRGYVLTAVHWITAKGEPDILRYPDSGRINAKVLWSLHYEWLFYIFALPACAGAMDIWRSRAWPTWTLPAALLALAIVARCALALTGHASDVLRYFPLFAIGMLAYELQLRQHLAAIVQRRVFSLLGVTALLAGMILAQYPYELALPLFGFFFVCVACGNDFGGILRSRGALVLGECSFGIYLLHGIVLNILFVDGYGYIAQVPIAIFPALLVLPMIAVVLITAVTFLVIERPAMQSGRRLGRRFAR